MLCVRKFCDYLRKTWLLSLVSCLYYHISCIMSLLSCLLHHVSCLMSPVPRLLPHFSCLTSPVSSLLSHASCFMSSVSRLLSHVLCLFYTQNSQWPGGAVGTVMRSDAGGHGSKSWASCTIFPHEFCPQLMPANVIKIPNFSAIKAWKSAKIYEKLCRRYVWKFVIVSGSGRIRICHKLQKAKLSACTMFLAARRKHSAVKRS